MTDHVQVEHLMDWANTFDPSLLQSEDDVETKFALPFFRLLGYTDEYRRGKYPIAAYQPRRPGRKTEIDQIYFSVSDPGKQSAKTALLLVEAKKAQERDLEDAIQQAKYYGNHLEPLFLVVTNGSQVKILKRRRYDDDELVFDITMDQLRDRNIATEVYNQLQFETVEKLKEQLLDPLRHAQYVELMQTLYNDALTFLDRQVTRIQAANYEDHKIADLLSRTFMAIIEDGTLQFQQNQVNAAKDALYPLWEQCRFNRHFIDPIIFPL